jgi:sulfur-oxidizing protein SoxX
MCVLWPLLLTFLLVAGVGAQPLAPYTIENGEIARSLTGQPGNPAQGRKIVAGRQKGLCLLCHAGPFPEERFQGDLAPTLMGVGARMSEGALRLRMVDGTKVNPDTIMPPYYRTEGLNRVAPNFRGKPLLNADEIEDVIAFLLTLREDGATGQSK